ncbi:MAG: hypothetical protein IJ252_11535 [Solobacterium sp.]|nr:hypothetical protein [Solobacterium sp.]
MHGSICSISAGWTAAKVFTMGMIDHIEKTEEGFKAIVHGTDDYDVETKLKDRDVPEMSCDCVYAGTWGRSCKHMAALMFAVEDMREKA